MHYAISLPIGGVARLIVRFVIDDAARRFQQRLGERRYRERLIRAEAGEVQEASLA